MESHANKDKQAQDSYASSVWEKAQMTVAPTAMELGAKFKSKGEVYHFLVVDVKMALPKYQQVTIWFLKDLMAGNKKCKCSRFPRLTPLL